MLRLPKKREIISVNDKGELRSLMSKIALAKDDSMFICDLSTIIEKYRTWTEKFPKVIPYYAVKSNNYPLLIKLLSHLGAGFDCATKGEIRKVLAFGGKPEKIIFGSPIKCPAHIRYAKEKGVDRMTFDSVQEIYKTKETFPDARMILRIRCDSSLVQVQLGKKFGCEPRDAVTLLKAAKDLDMNVIGVCFHVGTENQDPTIFDKALRICSSLFDEAKSLGYRFTLLDIGGGFLSNCQQNFEKTANVINAAIDKYFGNAVDVDIISEPGRYFSGMSFTLVTKVMSVREEFDGSVSYFINDGVYTNFNTVVFENKRLEPLVLKEVKTLRRFPCKLWGHTLDALDCIRYRIMLPRLNRDDVLIWEDMGAYSLCLNTKFHDYDFTETVNVIKDKDRIVLNQLNLI